MIKIGGRYPIVDVEGTWVFRIGEIVEVVRWAKNWDTNDMAIVRTCEGKEDFCYITRLGPEVRPCPMS